MLVSQDFVLIRHLDNRLVLPCGPKITLWGWAGCGEPMVLGLGFPSWMGVLLARGYPLVVMYIGRDVTGRVYSCLEPCDNFSPVLAHSTWDLRSGNDWRDSSRRWHRFCHLPVFFPSVPWPPRYRIPSFCITHVRPILWQHIGTLFLQCSQSSISRRGRGGSWKL